MNKKQNYFLAMLLLGTTACSGVKEQKTKEVKAIQKENMDVTVNPSQNFFNYVNGGWLKNTEIPSDKTRWGSFDELRDNTQADLKKVLDDAIASGNIKPGSDQQKSGRFLYFRNGYSRN